jgi:hypothetical protein
MAVETPSPDAGEAEPPVEVPASISAIDPPKLTVAMTTNPASSTPNIARSTSDGAQASVGLNGRGIGGWGPLSEATVAPGGTLGADCEARERCRELPEENACAARCKTDSS